MKASAQVSVGSVVPFVVSVCIADVGSDSFGLLGMGARGVRLAATDLQKSVLRGSERHCLHVPGPFMQGSVFEAPLVGFWAGVGSGAGGGLKSLEKALSLAISAQRQAVPSSQKPQGSGGATAGMETVEAEVESVGLAGVANWYVKSISVLLSRCEA